MSRIIEKRRKRRIEKIRRRKRILTVSFLVAVLVLCTQFVSLAFANMQERNIATVVVTSGDTIWSIAREYTPENKDVRKLVSKIKSENCIKDGHIYAGQELIIPLD